MRPNRSGGAGVVTAADQREAPLPRMIELYTNTFDVIMAPTDLIIQP